MVEALLGIQIVAIFFGSFMMYISYLHYKKQNITSFEVVFWILLWGTFIGFALFPRVLDPLLAKLFVTRAMDLLSISAFMVLAYLGFQNHVGIKTLQKQIEELVRTKALYNAKKK
jgi:hypothetical protein